MSEPNDIDDKGITNGAHGISTTPDDSDAPWGVEDAMECLRQNFQCPPELDEAAWEALMKAAVQSSQKAADLIDTALRRKE